MLEIHTVGAGGGSIARFDRGGALRVGPESAGAEPGPICYGRGELPTVTDAHAVLGHFGGAGLLGGSFPLDVARAASGDGGGGAGEEWPCGCACVCERRKICRRDFGGRRRGDGEGDSRNFGRARARSARLHACGVRRGGRALHACSLASALGMSGVLLPIFPGALSALGILRADVVTEFSRTVLLKVFSTATARSEIEDGFRSLESEGRRAMAAEGFAAAKIRIERRLDLRYAGQAYELSVAADGDFVAAFHRAHEARYGYHDAKRTVGPEIVNLRARATGVTEKPGTQKDWRPKLQRRTRLVFGNSRRDRLRDGWMPMPLPIIDCARRVAKRSDSLSGPAVISEYSATTLVPHGWSGRVDDYGQILSDAKASAVVAKATVRTVAVSARGMGSHVDPTRLEIFKNIFHSVAEEMGAALRRSAFSPNIKERRDYSCAVYDADGRVLAMGDHMPVHLGSMPASVAAARAAFALEPGDIALLNDPFAGGTHLPDLTMVMPIFMGSVAELIGAHSQQRARRQSGTKPQPDFYVANRAHHADVRGRACRLDPPRARNFSGRPSHPAESKFSAAANSTPMRTALFWRMFERPPSAKRRPRRANRRLPHRRASPHRNRRQVRTRPNRDLRPPPPRLFRRDDARRPARNADRHLHRRRLPR